MRGIERLLHKLSKQYLEERKVVAKAGAMMDEGFYGRSESWYCEAGYREEVYVALQDAASFHCLVKEGKDCEELQPKLKEK